MLFKLVNLRTVKVLPEMQFFFSLRHGETK